MVAISDAFGSKCWAKGAICAPDRTRRDERILTAQKDYRFAAIPDDQADRGTRKFDPEVAS